ncbi:hypothetical protein ScPMuIL_011239 [Solemya velum]
MGNSLASVWNSGTTESVLLEEGRTCYRRDINKRTMDKKKAKREKKRGGGFFSVFTACSGKSGKKETSVKTSIEEGAADVVRSELVVNSSKTSEQHNVSNQISAEGRSQEVELSKSLEQIGLTLKENPLQSSATDTDEEEGTAVCIEVRNES